MSAKSVLSGLKHGNATKIQPTWQRAALLAVQRSRLQLRSPPRRFAAHIFMQMAHYGAIPSCVAFCVSRWSRTYIYVYYKYIFFLRGLVLSSLQLIFDWVEICMRSLGGVPSSAASRSCWRGWPSRVWGPFRGHPAPGTSP